MEWLRNTIESVTEESPKFFMSFWRCGRVVFGALVIWVPWTILRFAACWSVPLLLAGEMPDIFTDGMPKFVFVLMFPFLVELLVPAWYVISLSWIDLTDVEELDLEEINAMVQQDILALRYRLMRPGIVTFVFHLLCMPFSPGSGVSFSWIPWAISFAWWKKHFPWYCLKPVGKDYVEGRSYRILRDASRIDQRLDDGVLTSEEAQQKIDKNWRSLENE